MASERDALSAELKPEDVPSWIQIQGGHELAELVRLVRFAPGQSAGFLHSDFDAQQLLWRWLLKWGGALLALGREQGRQEEQMRRPIMVDRDADLLKELRVYLDAQAITSENIGDVRRALFMPWDSMWNSWVRDETAARENRPGREEAGR